MLDSLTKNATKIWKMGLGHVFSAFTINKVIAFVTNILIVRFMSKSEYGLFSDAFNTYSFFNIFTGLGMLGSELLFCTEKRPEHEKKAIYKYTLKCGFLVDIILGFVMLCYAYSGVMPIAESKPILIGFAGLLAFEYIMQYFLIYYRTKLDNRKFSFLSVINTSSYLIFGVIGAYVFGAMGTLLGRYFAMLVPIVVATLSLKENITDIRNDFLLETRLKKDIWIYGIKNGLSSYLNHVIYLIDVAIISYIIADPEIVASYKLATLIPEGLNFVPHAIIVTVIPYFVKNKDNKGWIKQNTFKLLVSMGIMNCFITLFLLFSAPLLINLIGGEQYSDSVIYFRILSLSYFFLGTFRLFSTNVLAIFRKTTYNLVVAAINGVLNIILDVILVSNYQAEGAAWATMISVVIASMLSFPYLLHTIGKISK